MNGELKEQETGVRRKWGNGESSDFDFRIGASAYCPVFRGLVGRKLRKKRVSNFDEQSRYVIENKGSAKQTKPNKADFFEGENLAPGAVAARFACGVS